MDDLFEDDVAPSFALTTPKPRPRAPAAPSARKQPQTPRGPMTSEKHNKEGLLLTADQKLEFNRLVLKAKRLEQDEDTVSAALVLYRRALRVHPNDPKLPRKIASLQSRLAEESSSSSSSSESESEEDEDVSSSSSSSSSASESESEEDESGSSDESYSSEEEEEEPEMIPPLPSKTPARKASQVMEASEEEEEEEEEELADGVLLRKSLLERLYPYQREGIAWLRALHDRQPRGGVLGDDMGLGKTVQVAAFLAGMLASERIRTALIVCPLSIIDQWGAELAKWAPGARVRLFHGANKAEREKAVPQTLASGGVCLTTYGMLQNNAEHCCPGGESWDYVVLDEGHTIKNYTAQISQKVRLLRAERRLVMTGTPITNKLQELWSLLDWACPGLLGDRKTFKEEFEDRIARGTDRHATQFERQAGSQLAESLRRLISPHFLRREKKDVLMSAPLTPPRQQQQQQQHHHQQSVPATCPARSPTRRLSGRMSVSPAKKAVPGSSAAIRARKNDLIVWIRLSRMQQALYRSFLETTEVRDVLNRSKSPLAALGVLKKICNHPHLLQDPTDTSASLNIGALVDKDRGRHAAVKHSAKVAFLLRLLADHRKEGNRTLVFSQSTRVLDIIEEQLRELSFRWCRIDGSIHDRQAVIDEFNSNTGITCFLLTTQVGGVGLNLTAADRVVIFDPAWSVLDNQAVDRVYRIGQKRDVVVYRFMTCGTIEEKIYRKQVFKQSLMRATMEGDTPFRYFTKQELHELFTMGDPSVSVTQQQLHAIHGNQRRSYEALDRHLEFVRHCKEIFGVSDHDLLFSKRNHDAGTAVSERVEELVEQATSKVVSASQQPSAPAAEAGKEGEEIEDSPFVPETPFKPHSGGGPTKDRLNPSFGPAVVATTSGSIQKPLSEECCVEHTMEAQPCKTFRCRCFTSQRERDDYNALLFEFRAAKAEGDLATALGSVLSMLTLCDDDPLLHREAFDLGSMLGFASGN